ncbi:MAG TPA: hypothetical protein VFV57_05875 [Limnobacter sp.]|nr:hypothetical protein [Limnobacter sp.]
MGLSIDLKNCHLQRQHGDIVALYTWMNEERCLVLIPAYRKNSAWYVIMDSAAYKYDDPAYLATQCAKACEVLGMEPSQLNWVRLATIIHEGLPDLVSMPSAPPKEFHRRSFGEMHARANGEIIGSDLIRVEKEGASYG